MYLCAYICVSISFLPLCAGHERHTIDESERNEVLTELIPHFGEVPPVVDAVEELLNSPEKREQQQDDFTKVIEAFGDKKFSVEGATALLEKLG